MLIQYRTTGHQRNVDDGAGLLFSGDTMLITYKTTRHTRLVAPEIGRRLIASGIADSAETDGPPVPIVALLRANLGAAMAADIDAMMNVDAEISPRTGKPKRKYKRRDMVAEG